MVFLMVMNGVLLYLVIRPAEEKNRPARTFISDQLEFSAAQMEEFQLLEEAHHQKMRQIDRRLRELKEMLFEHLSTADRSSPEIDSIGKRIGALATERELEIFAHFSNIRDLCDERQKRRLNEIVKGALRPGPPRHRPPPHGGPPPPR